MSSMMRPGWLLARPLNEGLFMCCNHGRKTVFPTRVGVTAGGAGFEG